MAAAQTPIFPINFELKLYSSIRSKGLITGVQLACAYDYGVFFSSLFSYREEGKFLILDSDYNFFPLLFVTGNVYMSERVFVKDLKGGGGVKRIDNKYRGLSRIS